jgi:Fe-S-cluster containining protein
MSRPWPAPRSRPARARRCTLGRPRWAPDRARCSRPASSPGAARSTPLRPIICRLFAFAAVRDKRGAPELAICREHSAADPGARGRVDAYLSAGGEVAMFADLQSEAHEPDDGPAALVPINHALVAALERELLRARYGSGANSACQDGSIAEPSASSESSSA